jgi:acetyl-CoA C-acetyltransferase
MGNNPARIAALKAGIPHTAGALTVNNVCSSGMKAVELSAHHILLDKFQYVIAGGMESNSQTPYMLLNARWGKRLRNDKLVDALFYDGFSDTYKEYGGYEHVGETAENIIEDSEKICKKYNLPEIHLSRKQINQFAFESQKKYAKAQKRIVEEITPIKLTQRGKDHYITKDESPRPQVTLKKLRKLKPVFRKNGHVTAGNTPDLNDGAAALVMTPLKVAERQDLSPMGLWIDSASGNVEPKYMGLGPIPAIRKILKRNNLTQEDIDIFEINEAQAQQVLFCVKALGIDKEKVNVNGGAIAVGHPPGMTGARLILAALYELKRRDGELAICSLCAGGGTGMATLIQNLK